MARIKYIVETEVSVRSGYTEISEDEMVEKMDITYSCLPQVPTDYDPRYRVLSARRVEEN